METPLLSIIVPVYNTLDYLPRCVHSILAQTYQNLELLLVDDGSTDGTGALCDSLAREDGRIRVFHKSNGGSSSARNVGIRHAKGQYVGFVDSDDSIAPQMYEQLLLAIERNQVPIAQIGREEQDEQGNRLPQICIPPDREMVIGAELFLRELLLHKGDCSFCTKLIRRELLSNQQFPEHELNEDFHLLVQLLAGGAQIVSLPMIGYRVCYRMGSNSRKKDRNDFSRVFTDNVRNADWVYALVKQQFPALEQIAFRFGICQRLDYLLHIPISQMSRENLFYCEVVRRMRHGWVKSMRNPYLTVKNKSYHTLFVIAPKKIRLVHAGIHCKIKKDML